MIGYAEDILYYIARHFIQTGRGHEAFKDQRFWTDMFLAQVRSFMSVSRTSFDVALSGKEWWRLYCCQNQEEIQSAQIATIHGAASSRRLQQRPCTVGCQQVHKHGAHQGEEPTLGLDYEGRVFQMFRNFDKCAACTFVRCLGRHSPINIDSVVYVYTSARLCLVLVAGSSCLRSPPPNPGICGGGVARGTQTGLHLTPAKW